MPSNGGWDLIRHLKVTSNQCCRATLNVDSLYRLGDISVLGYSVLHYVFYVAHYRDADKSLARPGRKQATVTKLLTFASHSKKIQKVVRSTRFPRQQ